MRRGKGGAMLAVIATVALAAAATPAACVRHADLYDEPDGGGLTTTPFIDAGKVTPVDAGLLADGGVPCADRPLGNCQGPIDFPCDFEGFVILTAEQCQQATGCHTNGLVEVKLGTDGCAAEIGMTEPNQAMAECLVAAFEAVRCPCGATDFSLSLGQQNTSCADGG